MGLFSPAFQAATATKSGQESVFSVVDITFPSIGRRRYSEETPAAGSYSAAGRLVGGIESVTQAISQRPSDLGLSRVRFQLADTDKGITSILRGRYDCRRSPVSILWGHPSVSEEDWFPVFTGILDDWSVAAAAVDISATSDDRPLQGYVPRRQVLKGWAPLAPTDVLGYYVPIVLGTHDMNGLDTKGAVTLLPVAIDTSMYRYVVSLGTCKSVLRVYKGSTLLTVTTDYTVQQEALGGMTMTTVRLVSPSPAPTASDVYTADVEGITDTGATTGAVIAAPTEQLKWMLNNLIYSDWNGGSYSTTAAPIDPTSFSETGSYCSTFKYEGAQRIGGTTEQVTGISLVNGWLGSHPMIRARWGNDGKLGLRVIDHRWVPYSYEYLADGAASDVDRGFAFATSASDIVSKVSVEYLYGEAAGKFWQKLEVQDLARWNLEKVTQAIPLPWSASRFT